MTENVAPLSFRNVSRHYAGRERPAVDRVDLDLRDGEIFALLGESGCGKSTLLRLAAGLETPDAGSVLLDGVCVGGEGCGWRETPTEKRRLGLVFQDGALFPHLDAAGNVGFGLKGAPRNAIRSRASECLELVDLGGMENRYPHELSGGERQRLALARALAPEPRLLLLDEPFSHLDPPLRRRLRDDLRSILERLRQTVLLVTHDPEDALAMASRLGILVEGRIRQVGAPSEVYRFPVDRYCAERFGAANPVEDPVTNDTYWRRPEEAEWIPDAASDEGFAVVVESVRPMGRGVEVGVSREDGTRWICLLPEPVPVGARGRVAWREPEAEPGTA